MTTAMQITSGRATDIVGSTSMGPMGVNPSYIGNVNGGPGVPPASGCIHDSNPQHPLFWDFEYQDVNTGTFNGRARLVRMDGTNFGNPVVLYSAGMDYTTRGGGMCSNAPMSFQPVLELSVQTGAGTQYFDVSSATTILPIAVCPAGPNPQVQTTWMSADPTIVEVSVNGLLTARSENACTTISWQVTSLTPTLLRGSASNSFAACVDSGGIDTATRATWLPLGDLDATLPGLPSGMPSYELEGQIIFGITVVANIPTIAAYQVHYDYDSLVLVPRNPLAGVIPPLPCTGADVCYPGPGVEGGAGSTQGIPGRERDLYCPLVINIRTASLTSSFPYSELVWNDYTLRNPVNPPAIFDLGGVKLASLAGLAPVTTQVWLQNEVLADVLATVPRDPCLPAYPAPGVYATIGGSGVLRLPAQ